MEAHHNSVVSNPTITTRLKRENYHRTKHDRAFSEWKLLIGPTDWEDHLQKKEGAEKYRTQNLPNCSSCSGLYEFGIALIPTQSGREFAKLREKSIIPVYIGQSDNVRTRLQHYGRVGSHLENGFSKGELDDSNRNGLFGDIFARGFSIVYRWAPMENKNEAERKEAQLLNTFDYAWNKGSNGARRPNDIHKKLESLTSKSTKLPLQIFPQREVGLKIDTPKTISSENKYTFYTPNEKKIMLSRIFKFGRSQPRLVSTRHYNGDSTSICGVALGRGSVCIRPPVDGRKRCADHKGMKINGPDSKLIKEVKLEVVDAGTLCGEDGSFCTKQPVLGRKTCEEHKGMRVKEKMPKSKVSNISSVFIETSNMNSDRTVVKNEYSLACGATTVEGSFCRRKPSNGSKYCWQHEGTRQSKVSNISSVFIETSDMNSDRTVVKNEYSLTCGATTVQGSFCRRKPSNGSKYCWQHEGNMNSDRTVVKNEYSLTCGATTVKGSFCRRKPSNGSKYCWQHA